MTVKEEHVLFFAFVALAIVVLWEIRTVAPAIAEAVAPNDPRMSNVPTPDNSMAGAEYLTYNTRYQFGPPIMNVLPETTQGQVGQVSDFMRVCGGGC